MYKKNFHLPDFQNFAFFEMDNIDGLVQERRNSSALAMELRLSCTNPSIYVTDELFAEIH